MKYYKITEDVKLGKGVKIHDFVNPYGCQIGDYTKIGAFVEVQKNAKIGRNARYPTTPSLVKKGASIGTSSTIMCGITIGEGALIGAGSVVTKDVPGNAVVAGNPARMIRKIKNSRDLLSSKR